MSLGTLSYKPNKFKVFSKLGFRLISHYKLSEDKKKEALNANFDGDIPYFIKNKLWRKNLDFNTNAEIIGEIQQQFKIHHKKLAYFESEAEPADIPVINTLDISQIEELSQNYNSFCLMNFDVNTQEIKPIAYVVKLNAVLIIIPLMDVQFNGAEISQNVVIYSQHVVEFSDDFKVNGNLHVRAKIIECINQDMQLTADKIILQADEECVTRGEINANDLCEISAGKLRHKAKCTGKDIQIVAEEVRNKGQFFSAGSIDAISLQWQDKSESCAMHAHEKIMLFSKDYQKSGHISTPILIVNSERIKLYGNHFVSDTTFINGDNIEIAESATFVVNGKFITKSSWHQNFFGKLHYLSSLSMTGFNISVPKYCPVKLSISKKASDDDKPYFTRPDISLQNRRMYQERYAHKNPDFLLPQEVLEKKYANKNQQASDKGYVVLQANKLEVAGELNIAGVGLFLKANGDLSITGDICLTENSFLHLTEQFCMQAKNVIIEGKVRASRQHQTLIQAENNVDLHGDALASTMKITSKNVILHKGAELHVDALRVDAEQNFQAQRGSTLTIERGGIINSGYVGLHGHVRGGYLDVQANQLILITGTTHISHQIYSAPAVMLLGGWLNGKSVKVNALFAAMFGLVSAGSLEVNAAINVSLLAYIQSTITCPSVTALVNAAAGISLTALMIFVPQSRFIVPWVQFAINAVAKLTSLAITLKTAHKQIQDLMQKNEDHEVSKTELIKTISSMIIVLTLLGSSSYFAATSNIKVNTTDDKIPDLDWHLALKMTETLLPFFMGLFSGYSVTSLFSLSSNIIFSLSQTQYSLLNIQANIASLTGTSLNLSPISFDWNFASLGITMTELNFYNYKQPGMERFIAGDNIHSYIVDLHQQFLALNHYNNIPTRSEPIPSEDLLDKIHKKSIHILETQHHGDHSKTTPLVTEHKHSLLHDLMDNFLNNHVHRHDAPNSQPQPAPTNHTEPAKTDDSIKTVNIKPHIIIPWHDIPPVPKPEPTLVDKIMNTVSSTVETIKEYLGPDYIGLNISGHEIFATDDLQMMGCNLQADIFTVADNKTCILAGGEIAATIKVGQHSTLITFHEVVNGIMQQAEFSTVAFVNKSNVTLKQDDLSSDTTLVIDDSTGTIDKLDVGNNKVFVQNHGKLTSDTIKLDRQSDDANRSNAGTSTVTDDKDAKVGTIVITDDSDLKFHDLQGQGKIIETKNSTITGDHGDLQRNSVLVVDQSTANITDFTEHGKAYVQNHSKLTTNTTTIDSDKNNSTTSGNSDAAAGAIVINQSEYDFQQTQGNGELLVLNHSTVNGRELDPATGGQDIFVESDVNIQHINGTSAQVEFVLDHHMKIGDVHLQGNNALLSTEGSDGTIHDVTTDQNAIVSTDLSKIMIPGTYAVAGSSNFNDSEIHINHEQLIPNAEVHIAGSTLTYQSVNGVNIPYVVTSNMSMDLISRFVHVPLHNSASSIIVGDIGHHGYAPQIDVNAAHFNYNTFTLIYDLGTQPIILHGNRNVFGIVPLEFYSGSNIVYQALWQMNCPVSFTANGVLIFMAGSNLSASRLSLDANYGISGEGMTLTSASQLSIHSSQGNIELDGQKYTETQNTSHRKITGTSNQQTSEDQVNQGNIYATNGIYITADNGSVDLHATWLRTDPDQGEIHIIAKNHVDTTPIIGENKQTTTGFIPPLGIYRVDVSQEVAFPTYFSTNTLYVNGDIIYFGGTDISNTNNVLGRARVIDVTAPILRYQVSSESYGLSFSSLNGVALQDALRFPILTMFGANAIYHDLQNANASTTDIERSINLWNTGFDSLMLLSSMASNPLSVLNFGVTLGASQSNSAGTFSTNNVFHARRSIVLDADTVIIANGTEVSAGDETSGSVTIHAENLTMDGGTFTQDTRSFSAGVDISIGIDQSAATTDFPMTFGVQGQYAQSSDITHGMATIRAHDVTLNVDDIDANNGEVVARNLHGHVGTANFILQQDQHDNFSIGGSVRFAPDGTPVSGSLNFAMGHSSLANDQPGIIADNSDCTIDIFNGVGAVASQAVQDHTTVMNNVEVTGSQTQIGGSIGISSPVRIGNNRVLPIQTNFTYDHRADVYTLNGITTTEQHVHIPTINIVIPLVQVAPIDTSTLVSDNFDYAFNIQDPAIVLGVEGDIQTNDASQPSHEDEQVDISTIDASAIISDINNMPDPFTQNDSTRNAQEFWDNHDLPILTGDIDELAQQMNDGELADVLLPSSMTDIIPYLSGNWELRDDFNNVLTFFADGINQGIDDLAQADIALTGYINDFTYNAAMGVFWDLPLYLSHEYMLPLLRVAFDDIVLRNPILAIQDIQPLAENLISPAVLVWDIGISGANLVGIGINPNILTNTSERWHERNDDANYFLNLSWQEQVRFGSVWLANYLLTGRPMRHMEISGNIHAPRLNRLETWLTVNDTLQLPDMANNQAEAPVDTSRVSNSRTFFSGSSQRNTAEMLNSYNNEFMNSTSSNRSALFYVPTSRNTELQGETQKSYQIRK